MTVPLVLGCGVLAGLGARAEPHGAQAQAIDRALDHAEALFDEPGRQGLSGRDPACAELSPWTRLQAEVAALPRADRVSDQGRRHGSGEALLRLTCGFATFRWEDGGGTLHTAGVVVDLRSGSVDLDGGSAERTPDGRAIEVHATTLGAFTGVGGHGRERLDLTLAVLDAGSHTLAVAVHDAYVGRVDPAVLVDAAAEDLGIP